MLRRVALRAVVAFAALAVIGPAQAQQRSDQTFRTSTELVVIDMVAIDSRGRFITDLRLDEVEVREDGRRQKVELLRMVGAEPGGTTTPAPPGSAADAIAPAAVAGRALAAPDASRRLIIVIDSNSLAPETLLRVREALPGALADLPAS